MSDFQKTISVTNKKGGVGKTTSALNLAAALHTAGKRVLMIDNDHQGNLTAAVGLTPAEQKYTLANLLLAAIDYPEDVVLHLSRSILHIQDGLNLIPANKRLSDAAARLQVMQLSQYNTLDETGRSYEKMLDTVLAPLKPVMIISSSTAVCNMNFSQSTLWQHRTIALSRCKPISWPAKGSRMYWIWCVRCRHASIRSCKSLASC